MIHVQLDVAMYSTKKYLDKTIEISGLVTSQNESTK